MSRRKIKNNISYDDKRKKYYVTFFYGKNSSGKNIKKTQTFDKLREAENALKKFEGDKVNHKIVMPTKDTVKSYSEYWLNNEKRDLKETTKNNYKRMLDLHIIPYMGNVELQKVTRPFINKFFTYLEKDKGFGSRYVREHYDLLKSIFKTAIEDEKIYKNPLASIKPIKVPERESTVYTVKQLQKLFKLSEGTSLEIVVKLGGYLGLRRGEICGLKWQAVDMVKRSIDIVNSRTQAGKKLIEDGVKSSSSVRRLDIPDGLFDVLKRVKTKQDDDKKVLGKMYHDDGYVVCKTDGTPYKPTYLSDAFSKLLLKNHMPHIRLHDLRHTFATIAIANASIYDVSKELGHSEIRTTDKIYVKQTDRKNTRAINAVAAQIDNK